jgi:hypothetical protein
VGPANGTSIALRFTGSRGGQLRVVAKNANGISEARVFNIPDGPSAPTVQTAGFVCPTGGSATLTALGGTPGNFRWYTDSLSTTPIANEFNSTYTVNNITTTTRFWATYIGANGCEAERRGVNARYGKAAPGINTLPAGANPPTALQSVPTVLPDGVSNRVWRKDGVQIGTGAVVPVTGGGVYSLCFTNACGDSCTTYILTSVKTKLNGLDLSLFPNPSQQMLNLSIKGEWNGTLEMELQDVLGRKILKNEISKQTKEEMATYNLARLKTGIYFLSLQSGQEKTILRFVKE